MDAAINARELGFRQGGREARISPHRPGKADRFEGKTGAVTEEISQNPGGPAAEDGMGRNVFWMRGSRQQRSPGWISGRVWIAVSVGQHHGGNGTPIAIDEEQFGVPTRYSGIGQSEVHQREEPRGHAKWQLPLQDQRVAYTVPRYRDVSRPVSGDQCLLAGAR